MSDIIKSIEWAKNTIQDRTMFGMEDAPLQAAYAREMRASGVLLSCKNEILSLKKENETLKQENKYLKDLLGVAREALEFYGSEENWCKQTQCTFGLIKAEDQWNGTFRVGGKIARQALRDCEAVLREGE